MKNENNNNQRKPKVMLWFAGGIYLIYLAWDMINQYIKDPVKDGKLFFLIVAVFFGVVGIYFAVLSTRIYYKENKASFAPSEEQEEEDEAEPDAPLDSDEDEDEEAELPPSDGE